MRAGCYAGCVFHAAGLALLALIHAALFPAARRFYEHFARQGRARKAATWLVAGFFISIPVAIALAAVSDRMREHSLGLLAERVAPVVEAFSRGDFGPLETNNPGRPVISLFSGGRAVRTPKIQYRPLVLSQSGAERLSAELNYPFLVFDRSLPRGETLRFPIDEGGRVMRIAVATPAESLSKDTVLDITVLGAGATRRPLVLDTSIPAFHGWGEGNDRVEIREMVVDPPVTGAVAIELRCASELRIAGLAIRNESRAAALAPEVRTVSGMPMRYAAASGGRGVVLRPGLPETSFRFPDPVLCDRLWVVYTTSDPRAVDYSLFGEPILQIKIEFAGGRASEEVFLRHGEDVHSGNLDRSRHADDLASATALTWLSDGVRMHADQRRVLLNSEGNITKISFRNISGASGYLIDLLGVTAGTSSPVAPNAGRTPELAWAGDAATLSPTLLEALSGTTFAFADRQGVIRAASAGARLEGVTIDDTDLSTVLRGRPGPPRCGVLAGREGDVAWLPVTNAGGVDGALILFRPEPERAARHSRFALIPAAVLFLIIPYFIILLAESIAAVDRIRSKIIITLGLTTFAPLAVFVLVVPGALGGASAGAATRRLEVELQFAIEKLSHAREVATSEATAFFNALRDHPRVAPIFLAQDPAPLFDKLKKEIAMARREKSGARKSFVRLEIRGRDSSRTGGVIDDFDMPFAPGEVDYQGADYYKLGGQLVLAASHRFSVGELRGRLALGVETVPSQDFNERLRFIDLNGAPLDGKGPVAGLADSDIREMLERSIRANRAIPRDGKVMAVADVFRDANANPVFGIVVSEPFTDPTMSFMGASFPSAIWLGFVAVMMALAGMAVVRIITNRLTRPVDRLLDEADIAKSLGTVVPMDVGSVDEIGSLAERFHAMSSELVRRVQSLGEIQRGIWTFAGRLDRTEVAREASRFASNATGSVYSMVLLPDPQGLGWRAHYPDQKSRSIKLTGILEWVVSADEWLLVADDGPQILKKIRELQVEGMPPIRCVYGGPIRLGQRTEGFLILTFSRLAGRAERQGAIAAAGAIAIALENARIHGLAIEDRATGALVPHFFELRVLEEIERARALGRSLWLLKIQLISCDQQHRDPDRAMRLIVRAMRRAFGRLRQPFAGKLGPLQLCLAAEAPAPDEIARVLDGISRRSDRPIRGTSFTFDARSAVFPGDAPSGEALLQKIKAGDTIALPSNADLSDLSGGVEFKSPVFRETLIRAARLARVDLPILVVGEAGTGRESLIRRMHRLALGDGAPFVVCPVALIPKDLIEAELFGVEPGAFSGATEARRGYFERAHGGTLVLSEIHLSSQEIQSKLLRVLEEKTVRRLGSASSIPVRVRIATSATHDLTDDIRAGRMRGDLYYRLAGAVLQVPPLRERREDIVNLALQILETATRGKKRISAQALDRLLLHAWPGNITELNGVLSRAIVLCGDRDEIGQGDIEIAKLAPSFSATATAGSEIAALPLTGQTGRKPIRRPKLMGAELDMHAETTWNERQRRLLGMLGKGERITTSDYIEIMKVSPRTGLRDLDELVKRGRLRREGRKRGTSFRVI